MKTPALRQVWEENFFREQKFITQVVLSHNYVTVATRFIPLPTAPSPASSAAARATRVIPLPTAPSPASSAAARATRVIPLPTAPSPASSAAARATRVILLPTAPSPASSSAAAAGATLPTFPTLDENYAFFRQRANNVRLLQLGLTFSDEGGNLPKDTKTGESYFWEFNVKVAKSMGEIDAVFRQHLTEMGIDVDYNMKHGIHPDMLCTGIWCMETLVKERIRWVVFSGCAAFSPLINILRPEQLPVRREAFLDAVKLYFPKFYELRQLMSGCGLSGTLEETANVLGAGVTEGDMFNQAGPDSLLTLRVFMGLRERHFRRGIPEDQANLINYIS
ncbi:putative CCR4-associated factor 1-like protein 10 [Nymphaea thermarum]|nr:putative CCR4-associated factor 1-like protein 10 [Nymphaea thermarum]